MLRAALPTCGDIARTYWPFDKFQHRGLGTYLLDRAIAIARREGIAALEAATLSESLNMKDMFAKAGFRFSAPEDGVVTAMLRLQ